MAEANGNGGARWQTIAAIAVPLGMVVAAILWFGGLSSQVAIVDKDTSMLRTEVRDLSNKVGTMSGELVSSRMALKEVETQLCSIEQIRNLMHKTDYTNTAILWEKIMGGRFPTDNMSLPIICAHPTASGN